MEWHWQAEQANSFTSLKELIKKAHVLKYFNSSKSTKLPVDADSKGLEEVLLQDNHPHCLCIQSTHHIPAYYAQIELAVTFGSMNTFLACLPLKWRLTRELWKPYSRSFIIICTS